MPRPVSTSSTSSTSAGASSTDAAASSTDIPAGHLGRGSLGRQMVIRMVLLVAVVAVALSAFTALAARQLLVRQVDSQLAAVQGRVVRDGPDAGQAREHRAPPGIDLPGQPIGTLLIIWPPDDTAHANVLAEGGAMEPVLASAVQQVAAESPQSAPHSMTLDGLGRYRVLTYTTPDGLIVAVGLPLYQVDHTLHQLLWLEGALTVLAMIIAALGAWLLVRRSLRPLNRLASAAQQVSQLELSRGDTPISVRVPAADASPTSEVGRVGHALNHMLANVDAALTARRASELKVRQFVADASHELRNPLAAIRGYAELTRHDRDQVPAQTAYAMSRVESETERMSHLVEDLLLLARLDTGPDLDRLNVDLTEIVINAVNDARVSGPDHVWSLQLPEQPIEVTGDRNRLHQVVANLLANARTHTPPGTRVQTGLALDGDTAVITVSDDGPGIPLAAQPHIFERFARVDSSRKRQTDGGSTGLGLAIVTAVVEAHHGQVSVTSGPGQTSFSVRLPVGG